MDQACAKLGLGTFQISGSAAVVHAVKSGYRLIDCAAAYFNQDQVGVAFAQLFEERIVERDDLFVVSKLPNTHHVWTTGSDEVRVERSIRKTLTELKLDSLDLFLMHWPFAFEDEEQDYSAVRLPDGRPDPAVRKRMEYKATWAAMEDLVDAGLTKHVGVSNFTIEQLEDLKSVARIKPYANQVEVHPYHTNDELRAYCAREGIKVMAYSPLGSSKQVRACKLLGKDLRNTAMFGVISNAMNNFFGSL